MKVDDDYEEQHMDKSSSKSVAKGSGASEISKKPVSILKSGQLSRKSMQSSKRSSKLSIRSDNPKQSETNEKEKTDDNHEQKQGSTSSLKRAIFEPRT